MIIGEFGHAQEEYQSGLQGIARRRAVGASNIDYCPDRPPAIRVVSEGPATPDRHIPVELAACWRKPQQPR